jgi:hypothetical protein
MLENYELLENGLIKQLKILKSKPLYDYNYVDNSYNKYGEKGPQMAGMRLGVLLSVIKMVPDSILDVGYGNGDFLKVCSQGIKNCYGNDISNYPLPDSVTFVKDIFDKHYDVVCFFDVLEHFEDINFIKNIDCNYIFISVPWCHYFSDEWFLKWKHRREDEHLWHFNDISIVNFFNEMGFDLIFKSNFEDIIRTPADNNENILTCIFKKKCKI